MLNLTFSTITWRRTTTNYFIHKNTIGCYQNRNPWPTFCGDNLISKNLKKKMSMMSHFSTHTNFELGAPKVFENIREMYVVEFPFKKIARLNFKSYKLTKTLLEILFWKCPERKRCFEISIISKIPLESGPFPLTL